jgi:3-hydroxy-9,10-secoandrosta-1,3,5(10)-triene-9,17-dione monooxygenase
LSETSKADTAATPDPKQLVARAREMIQQIGARAREARLARRVPEQTISEIEEAGFFRILQPVRWGGYEMEPQVFYDVLIALAEADMSVGWVYGVLGVHPWLMGLMDDRAVREVWGNDNRVRLCSSLMPVGRAEPIDGGFRLRGHWRFASGCHHAQWALLGGAVQSDAAGPPDILLFLVPQSDYRIADSWYVSGLCATGSEDILVDETIVPAHRTRRMEDNLRCVGPGQAINPSPLYKLPFGQIFFRGVSSPSIGALAAMLNSFVAYSRQRSGPAGKAIEDPVAQQICAETTAAIDEMKLILHRNMTGLFEFAQRGEIPPMELRYQFKFQSAATSHRCAELAARLMRATGAAGIYNDHPFGHALADINAGRQHIANQVEMIGRNWGARMLGGKVGNDFML